MPCHSWESIFAMRAPHPVAAARPPVARPTPGPARDRAAGCRAARRRATGPPPPAARRSRAAPARRPTGARASAESVPLEAPAHVADGRRGGGDQRRAAGAAADRGGQPPRPGGAGQPARGGQGAAAGADPARVHADGLSRRDRAPEGAVLNPFLTIRFPAAPFRRILRQCPLHSAGGPTLIAAACLAPGARFAPHACAGPPPRGRCRAPPPARPPRAPRRGASPRALQDFLGDGVPPPAAARAADAARGFAAGDGYHTGRHGRPVHLSRRPRGVCTATLTACRPRGQGLELGAWCNGHEAGMSAPTAVEADGAPLRILEARPRIGRRRLRRHRHQPALRPARGAARRRPRRARRGGGDRHRLAAALDADR